MRVTPFQMKEVYLDQPPFKTDKKFAPTIALRVKQLMHHLRMAEVTILVSLGLSIVDSRLVI